jgi:undecaprenyl-diphosphatase
MRRLGDLARRIGRSRLIELRFLVPLALIAAGTYVFLHVASEVGEGGTHALDTRLLLALRSPGDPADPIGPIWLEELVRDITSFGGVGILAMITAAVAGYLALARSGRDAVVLLLAVGGGELLASLLKLDYDRPRPDIVPHGMAVLTSSFPSGHAMLSATTYLTLGALLARAQPERRLKAYLLAIAILLTLMVGASRVYLGVHWPTDVLAGWAAGASWAILCWLVATWSDPRG